MRPGQVLTRWWQDWVAGRLRSPQDLCSAARNEVPDDAQASDAFFGRDPVDRWEAPKRLRAPNFMLTDAFLRQWDRADWQHADTRLMIWSAMLIEAARKRGIPLYVHCAFRTAAEQHQMVVRGVSRTSYPNSAHNIGEAVDIVHGVYHWEMTRQEWDLIGVLGQLCLDRFNAGRPKDAQLHLTWGGKWRSPWDPAHWEIADYRQRTRMLQVGEPVRWTPRAILRKLDAPPPRRPPLSKRK